MSYEGSEASYHTPPVEGSPANDSSQENIPSVDRAEGIPDSFRLVPLTEDISIWEAGADEEAEWRAAEEAEQELEDRDLMCCLGTCVRCHRLGRQTCVKSVKKAEPYPHLSTGRRRRDDTYHLGVLKCMRQ